MSTIINADTSNGLKLTSDTSGEIELQANGVTKAKITANGLQDNNGNSLRGGSYRNLLINGDMRIAQRGTSVTGITSNGLHTVDRWFFVASPSSGIGTWTNEQSTDVPSGQGFANSFKTTCTTADASPASTDICQFLQSIEGQNMIALKKGTSNAESVTLSFWVKSNKTGTYTIDWRDSDNNRHICASYTISSSDTWEKKTITFAGDTVSAFTYDNSSCGNIAFNLAAGSSFTSGTLATSWASRDIANIAVGQVNLADATSNYWQITGVQLEVGEGASDFEHLPYDVQLQRCQRYYWQLMVNPDVNSRHKSHDTTTHFGASGAFPVTMRIDNPSGTEISAPTLANCTVFGVYSDGNSYNIIVSPTSANIAYYIKEGLYGFSAEL